MVVSHHLLILLFVPFPERNYPGNCKHNDPNNYQSTGDHITRVW